MRILQVQSSWASICIDVYKLDDRVEVDNRRVKGQRSDVDEIHFARVHEANLVSSCRRKW